MTAQIFKHDNKPAAELELNLQGPPILAGPRAQTVRAPSRFAESGHPTGVGGIGSGFQAKRAASPPLQSQPPTLPDRGLRRPIAEPGALAPSMELPPVVLRLPDLDVDADEPPPRVFDISNLLSWVGIGLGAIVAVALIWSSPKTTDRPLDEAPAWESAGSTAASRPDIAPVARDRAEVSAPPRPDISIHETTPDDSSSRPPANANQPPAPDEGAGQQARQEPTVRTARGPDSTWDGSASRPRPGEAAPVGRIMNVTVPQ